MHCVLTTNEEHKHLRKEKLSSKMPDDWDGKDWTARYREVGISLVGQEMSRGLRVFDIILASALKPSRNFELRLH